MDGDFVITHEYIISPWGIAVESDAILVTDTQLCALIIITDHKFIRMGGPGVGKSSFTLDKRTKKHFGVYRDFGKRQKEICITEREKSVLHCFKLISKQSL